MTREEFFRLKKVQAKKKKDMMQGEADARAALEKISYMSNGQSNGNGNGNGNGGDNGNMLEPERDDDVLF